MSRIRAAFREQFAESGVFDALVRRRTFDGVMVLCYHAVRADAQADGAMPFEGLHVRRSTFEAHCQVLSRLCSPMSMAQWRKALAGEEALPSRPVLITFDDGYQSVATEALPVLERYGIPATLFICSDPVARGEMFWHDAVACARGEDAVTALKTVPYAEWRSAFEQARRRVDPQSPTAPLSPAAVQRLAKHPLIEIGGHSHRHPILARGDRAAQREEIVQNLETLSSWTGTVPRVFAYPNGRVGLDYTALTEQLLAEAGVDHAFSTNAAMAASQSPALSLPRFTVVAGIGPSHLLHRLAWLWR